MSTTLAAQPDTSLPPHPDAIRMESITKRFPGIVANDNVRLVVASGAFHAVIGENGAGKSTLLNILYGRYHADEGRILLRGDDVTRALHSPADAILRGIGLVSQHYALIAALSVLENVMLGAEPTLAGGMLNREQAASRVRELTGALDLGALDMNTRADSLSVAAQQKVEILKALYRGAEILLLDEPTATLAPQEADALFALLHTLVAEGKTVVFVTHKLREVMAHSDAVTVLRAGKSVAHFRTSDTNPQELLRAMIGERQGDRETGDGRQETKHSGAGAANEKKLPHSPVSLSPLLRIEGLTVRNARRVAVVKEVTLEVGAGEIVGVAGVDGSGQRELSEAIVGLRTVESGRITLSGEDVTRRSVRARQRAGIGYIPEDRHRSGMVMDFSIAENYLLGHESDAGWGGGVMLKRAQLLDRAKAMIRAYDVRGGERGPGLVAKSLSGGNQQKVVFARAMDGNPKLLIACQPTRGLDVEAARFVYETLRAARDKGLSVLLFSLDLDEIFELSDRIAVMYNGTLSGILPRAEANPDNVGALMTTGSFERQGAGVKTESTTASEVSTRNAQRSTSPGGAE